MQRVIAKLRTVNDALDLINSASARLCKRPWAASDNQQSVDDGGNCPYITLSYLVECQAVLDTVLLLPE